MTKAKTKTSPKAPAGVHIKYIGSGNRFIDKEGRWDQDYEWTAENDFVCLVTDPDLVDNLLHYPYPDWEILDEVPETKADKPIAIIPGVGGRAAELAAHGIYRVGELAKADVDFLASNTGASKGEIAAWSKAAQALVGQESAETED